MAGARGTFPSLIEHLRAIAKDECVFDDADVQAIAAAADELEQRHNNETDN